MKQKLNQILRKICLVAAMGILLVSYQNCSKIPLLGKSGSTSTDNGSQPVSLAAQDYLAEPAPDLICGEAGYSYLMRNYLVRHCGSCHDGKGGLPTSIFANAQDIAGSYSMAKLITKSEFITTTTANRFCGSACSISTQGETYKAVIEWLDHKNCP